MNFFHWKNGWYFRRLADGAVEIRKYDESQRTTRAWGVPLSAIATIPAAEWASIVSAVAPDGGKAEEYQAALATHAGEEVKV